MCEDKLAHLREFVCIKLYRKHNYCFIRFSRLLNSLNLNINFHTLKFQN